MRRVLHSGIATFRKGAFQTGLGDKTTDGGHSYLKTRHDDLASLPPSEVLSDNFGAWQAALMSQGGLLYEAVDASSPPVDVGDTGVTLKVLGPRLVNVPGAGALLPWFADEPHTINGHSVVLRLTHGDARLLFSGDVNVAGSRNLLADPTLAAGLDAHVLKAPHHGRQRVHAGVPRGGAAGTTVISWVTIATTGTPRQLPRRHRPGDALFPNRSSSPPRSRPTSRRSASRRHRGCRRHWPRSIRYRQRPGDLPQGLQEAPPRHDQRAQRRPRYSSPPEGWLRAFGGSPTERCRWRAEAQGRRREDEGRLMLRT